MPLTIVSQITLVRGIRPSPRISGGGIGSFRVVRKPGHGGFARRATPARVPQVLLSPLWRPAPPTSPTPVGAWSGASRGISAARPRRRPLFGRRRRDRIDNKMRSGPFFPPLFLAHTSTARCGTRDRNATIRSRPAYSALLRGCQTVTVVGPWSGSPTSHLTGRRGTCDRQPPSCSRQQSRSCGGQRHGHDSAISRRYVARSAYASVAVLRTYVPPDIADDRDP